MPILYKYRSFDDLSLPKNEHYTNNIILNSSLYFSAIENLNDPFDCKLSYRQEYTSQDIREYFRKYLKRNPDSFKLEELLKIYGDNQNFIDYQNKSTDELIARLGVLSLSTNPNSILMWSHYSHNHTGLVFQFTPEKDSTCFKPFYLVDYSSNYNLLSYTSNSKDEIPKLMLTKHSDWKYESEVRMIDLDYHGEKKFKKHELTSIIFGALAKEDDIIRIVELCKENGFEHVKFSKAELSSGAFSLKYREIVIDIEVL